MVTQPDPHPPRFLCATPAPPFAAARRYHPAHAQPNYEIRVIPGYPSKPESKLKIRSMLFCSITAR